jgi:hypothetical protein
MNIIIKPFKMDAGMITAVQVITDGKEEVYNIPPAPFEGWAEMQRIIQKYYELDAVRTEAEQEVHHARQRLALVEVRYRAALHDFRLLVSPEELEKKPEWVQEPIPTSTQADRKILPPVQQEPKPMEEKAPETEIAETEAMMKASETAHEHADKIWKEFKEQQEEKKPASLAPTVLKESPELKVAEISEKLPPKAKEVLASVADRFKAAQGTTDTGELLLKKPETAQEWCFEIEPQISKLFERKQFDIDALEQAVADAGVPEKHIEKVSELMIAHWQRENRFEKRENPLTMFLKSMTKKKKKEQPRGK